MEELEQKSCGEIKFQKCGFITGVVTWMFPEHGIQGDQRASNSRWEESNNFQTAKNRYLADYKPNTSSPLVFLFYFLSLCLLLTRWCTDLAPGLLPASAIAVAAARCSQTALGLHSPQPCSCWLWYEQGCRLLTRAPGWQKEEAKCQHRPFTGSSPHLCPKILLIPVAQGLGLACPKDQQGFH